MTPAELLHDILRNRGGCMFADEAEMIASIAGRYPVVVCFDNAGRQHILLKEFKKQVLTFTKSGSDCINEIYFWLPVHIMLCATLDIPHALSTDQQINRRN